MPGRQLEAGLGSRLPREGRARTQLCSGLGTGERHRTQQSQGAGGQSRGWKKVLDRSLFATGCQRNTLALKGIPTSW